MGKERRGSGRLRIVVFHSTKKELPRVGIAAAVRFCDIESRDIMRLAYQSAHSCVNSSLRTPLEHNSFQLLQLSLIATRHMCPDPVIPSVPQLVGQIILKAIQMFGVPIFGAARSERKRDCL